MLYINSQEKRISLSFAVYKLNSEEKCHFCVEMASTILGCVYVELKIEG